MDWDTALFYKINGFVGQSAILDYLMVECSNPRYFLLSALLYMAYRSWISWKQVLIVIPILGIIIGVGDFVGLQLKNLFARPRPCEAFLAVDELIGCGGSFSMPSNHALNSSSVGSFFGVVYPSTRWVVGFMVFFIGLSRVYLGAHYPTDVLAGWSLGAMWGMTIGFVVLQLETLQNNAKDI